jgi:hypothetical protein
MVFNNTIINHISTFEIIILIHVYTFKNYLIYTIKKIYYFHIYTIKNLLLLSSSYAYPLTLTLKPQTNELKIPKPLTPTHVSTLDIALNHPTMLSQI